MNDHHEAERGRSGGAIMAAIRGALRKIMPEVKEEIRETAQREAQLAGEAFMGRVKREIDDATSRAIGRVDGALDELEAKLAEIRKKMGAFDAEFDSIVALGEQEGAELDPFTASPTTQPHATGVAYSSNAAEQSTQWLEQNFDDIDKRLNALEAKGGGGPALYQSSADLIHTGSAAEWADLKRRVAKLEIALQWHVDQTTGSEGDGMALLQEAEGVVDEYVQARANT